MSRQYQVCKRGNGYIVQYRDGSDQEWTAALYRQRLGMTWRYVTKKFSSLREAKAWVYKDFVIYQEETVPVWTYNREET